MKTTRKKPAIIDYIRNAKDYIYDTFSDRPLSKIIDSDKAEHIMLVPNSLVIYREDFAKIFEKYYVSEMFELSNFVLGTYNEPYMFLHLVKQPVKEFKIGVYYEPAHLYRDDIFDPDISIKRIPATYRDDYLDYLSSLDAWRQTDIQPQDVKYKREYRTISYYEFNPEVVYSRFYLDYNEETRRVLRGENLSRLSELAEILNVYLPSDEKPIECRSLDSNRLPSYPYIPEKDTVKSYQSTEMIHKGDIIVVHSEKFFLVDKDAEFDIYAPMGTQIIRPKEGVSPEYLYLFLRSKIAWRIRSVLTIPAGDHSQASSRNLADFPIVLPHEEESYYKEKFYRISNPDERLFTKVAEEPKGNNVESFLRAELLDSIRLNNETLLKKHIEESKNEIVACYKAGAYKSVILLIGSVLEALLLDWISEIEQQDYYNEKMDDYESLDLYIKKLKDKYGVNWPESKKAYAIKKKRNLIHIKLCLRREETITKELCEEYMEYLDDIIQSRERLLS